MEIRLLSDGRPNFDTFAITRRSALKSTMAKPLVPIVFVGPSGIGKGTITKAMMTAAPGRFAFSVSHTSRSPRAGEVDGVDYHFTTRARFEEDLAAGKFLEYCEVHGNLYGTSYAAIRSVADSGRICILDVNIDGAIAISKTDFRPFIIFLRPVSFELLEERLRGRGTESDEVVRVRLQTAKRELERREEYPGLWNLDIVNDKLDDTLAAIRAALTELYGFDPLVPAG
jgi:guanylate kinase